MPLQNRIDPFGRIIRTSARGAWTGNRGVIHDADKTIRRDFRLKAWLICELEHKGVRRIVMTPNRWTELFFLDEATALAAGHRPCCECRRAAYQDFKRRAAEGVGVALPKANDMDDRLHAERRTPTGGKRTSFAEAQRLPDGAFYSADDAAWLVWRGEAHRWTPFGYDRTVGPPKGEVTVLTPRLTLGALKAGYRPQVALT